MLIPDVQSNRVAAIAVCSMLNFAIPIDQKKYRAGSGSLP